MKICQLVLRSASISNNRNTTGAKMVLFAPVQITIASYR